MENISDLLSGVTETASNSGQHSYHDPSAGIIDPTDRGSSPARVERSRHQRGCGRGHRDYEIQVTTVVPTKSDSDFMFVYKIIRNL